MQTRHSRRARSALCRLLRFGDVTFSHRRRRVGSRSDERLSTHSQSSPRCLAPDLNSIDHHVCIHRFALHQLVSDVCSSMSQTSRPFLRSAPHDHIICLSVWFYTYFYIFLKFNHFVRHHHSSQHARSTRASCSKRASSTMPYSPSCMESSIYHYTDGRYVPIHLQVFHRLSLFSNVT